MHEMVSIDDSISFMKKLREKFYYNRGVEEINVDEALDRELAEDIVSPVTLPKHDLATMDGYAIRSSDSYPLKIVGSIYAGNESDTKLNKGEAFYITTGAALPRGADAVLKVELAEVKGSLLYGKKIKSGTYVLKRGSEVKEGEVVIEAKRRIGPQEIAVLHSLGIKKVKVYRKMRVAVFSNGDEIKRGMRNDTNGPMIMSFLRKWGHEPAFLGITDDSYEEIREMIIEGTKEYDAVVTSGGVSVGRKDYVIKVLKEEGDLLLYRVKQRPGKPLAIGIVNNKPVFALPGKPAGAFISMMFALRAFFYGDIPFPKIRAKIAHEVKIPTKGFTYIVFVKIADGKAFPVGYVDSPVRLLPKGDKYAVSLISQMTRTVLADGFLLTERDLEEGEEVEVNLY